MGNQPLGEPTRQEYLEYFSDYEEEKDLLRIEGVSDELIADSEAVTAEWADMIRAELSPEGMAAIVSGVALGCGD